MAAKTEQYTLKREVGWFGSFAMGYADVGADIFIALGLVTLYAGGASLLAFVIASLTYVCTGLSYAELTTAYPYAGGAQVYAMKALNDLVGFVAGWAVMLTYTVDLAFFSLASVGYLSFFFPALKQSIWTAPAILGGLSLSYLGLGAFIMVCSLLGLNVLGIRESSSFNEALTTPAIIVQVLILAVGFFLAFDLGLFLNQIRIVGSGEIFQSVSYPFPGTAVSTQNFIYAVTLAMTSFIGIESIAQAAEETRRPHRWIPLAYKLSILCVIAFTIGFSTLAIGVMPWTDLAGSINDPLTALTLRFPYYSQYLALIVALTGFIICYVSTNTGVIGVSRIVFSMGRFRLLPGWFYHVHPRFKTPYRTIIVFGIVGAALAAIGQLPLVADLYSFAALFSYMIVNACLIILRNTDPEVYRPWKVPGSLKIRILGRPVILPIIALLGAIACGVTWTLVMVFHPEGRLVGTVWMLIGVAGFIIYRRAMGLSPLSRQGSAMVAPVGYVFNALVLVRTPEEEESLVHCLKESLDKRMQLTLLSIIDPADVNLSLEEVKGYEQIKIIEVEAGRELASIAGMLRDEGYTCQMRISVGPMQRILKAEVESPENDLVVLVRRKTTRGKLMREPEDSVHAIVSKSRKLMVVRRS